MKFANINRVKTAAFTCLHSHFAIIREITRYKVVFNCMCGTKFV